MYYRYEIKENNGDKLLYLYLDMNYEFSSELGLDTDGDNLSIRTKDFIKNNKIDYTGNKVFIVVNGIVVKSVSLDDKDDIEILDEKKNYSNDNYLVTLELSSGVVVEIKLKDYLMGVLAENMIPDLHSEALKSMCILYRTYVFKEMLHNHKVKALNKFQIYKPISYFKLIWFNNFEYLYSKLDNVISSTDCMFLSYNNEYVYPFIHISNNGSTDFDINYPYLSKVDSLWDYLSPYYLNINEYTIRQFCRLLGVSKDNINDIKIDSVSEGKRIKKLIIDNKQFSGSDFKRLLNLRSEDNTIIINPNDVKVISRGFGNNLGLSQFGSNELSKSGASYIQILKYYFPLCKIKKYL